MPRLTQAERNRAIDMVDMGASQRQIARTFNCSQAAMSNLLSHYQQTGQAQLRPRSGRSESQRQLKTATSRQSTCGTDSDGDVNGGHSTGTATISRRTVLRRLRRAGIRAFRAFRGMALTLLHRQRRLQWARTVCRWQRRDWERVLFTGESRFNMFRNNGRVHVYRRRRERLAPNCIQDVHPFGGGGVMVWGGICGQRTTRIIIIRGNHTSC